MFGYININRKELSEENRSLYQSFYCGLCRELKVRFGMKAQLLLNYDITFLTILLTGLYEPNAEQKQIRCAIHPFKERNITCNDMTMYAADMNVLLGYHNLMDDYRDDRNIAKKMFANMILPDYRRIAEQYPRQAQAVASYMEQLAVFEKSSETNIDVVAGLTGEMLGELFVYKEDEWSRALRSMGFYLGKFIYLQDAYEDLERDIKKGNYNPLKNLKEQQENNFEAVTKLMMTSMMSECAKSFERLPILTHAEILRNIIYSGVWTRYEYTAQRREKKRKP